MFVEPEPKFQAPAPTFESFWLRLQPSKIVWAQAPARQPWWEDVKPRWHVYCEGNETLFSGWEYQNKLSYAYGETVNRDNIHCTCK